MVRPRSGQELWALRNGREVGKFIRGLVGLTRGLLLCCRRGEMDRARGGGDDHADKHRRRNGDADRHRNHHHHRSHGERDNGHVKDDFSHCLFLV